MEISGRGAALVVFVIAAAAAVSLPLFLVATVFIMVVMVSSAWPGLKKYMSGQPKDKPLRVVSQIPTSASLQEHHVDIYKLPESLNRSVDTITLGDLHGNTVKLVHTLFLYDIISFKPEVEGNAAYKAFVQVYEQLADAAEAFLDYTTTLPFRRTSAQRLQEMLNRLDQLDVLEQKGALNEHERTWKNARNRGETVVSLRAALGHIERITERVKQSAARLPGLIRSFNEFLNRLQVGRAVKLVRLIGDEMSDRGSNDYLTLRLLHWLRMHSIRVRIIISNHSQDFVTTFERFLNKLRCCGGTLRPSAFAPQGMISYVQKLSLLGLQMLINRELVSVEEVVTLFRETYAPMLHVLDCSVRGTNAVRLFTHAPIGFRTIKRVADRLQVDYDDNSIPALLRTIERVNTAFAVGVANHTTHTWCSSEEYSVNPESPKLAEKYPLIDIIWNRWNAVKDRQVPNLRPTKVNGYEVEYVHGHDTFQSPRPNIINLDTPCGKVRKSKQDERVAQFKSTLKTQSGILPARTQAMMVEYLQTVNLLKVLEETKHR